KTPALEEGLRNLSRFPGKSPVAAIRIEVFRVQEPRHTHPQDERRHHREKTGSGDIQRRSGQSRLFLLPQKWAAEVEPNGGSSSLEPSTYPDVGSQEALSR